MDTPEPTIETPAYTTADRVRLWLLFGAFGAFLAIALEQLFSRTGPDLSLLAWLVGGLATLSFGALAEIGINIRNKIEQQFPTERWTQKFLRDDS